MVVPLSFVCGSSTLNVFILIHEDVSRRGAQHPGWSMPKGDTLISVDPKIQGCTEGCLFCKWVRMSRKGCGWQSGTGCSPRHTAKATASYHLQSASCSGKVLDLGQNKHQQWERHLTVGLINFPSCQIESVPTQGTRDDCLCFRTQDAECKSVIKGLIYTRREKREN